MVGLRVITTAKQVEVTQDVVLLDPAMKQFLEVLILRLKFSKIIVLFSNAQDVMITSDRCSLGDRVIRHLVAYTPF